MGNFHPSMVVKIKKHLKFNMVTSLVMELGSTVLSKSLYIKGSKSTGARVMLANGTLDSSRKSMKIDGNLMMV